MSRSLSRKSSSELGRPDTIPGISQAPKFRHEVFKRHDTRVCLDPESAEHGDDCELAMQDFSQEALVFELAMTGPWAWGLGLSAMEDLAWLEVLVWRVWNVQVGKTLSIAIVAVPRRFRNRVLADRTIPPAVRTGPGLASLAEPRARWSARGGTLVYLDSDVGAGEVPDDLVAHGGWRQTSNGVHTSSTISRFGQQVMIFLSTDGHRRPLDLSRQYRWIPHIQEVPLQSLRSQVSRLISESDCLGRAQLIREFTLALTRFQVETNDPSAAKSRISGTNLPSWPTLGRHLNHKPTLPLAKRENGRLIPNPPFVSMSSSISKVPVRYPARCEMKLSGLVDSYIGRECPSRSSWAEQRCKTPTVNPTRAAPREIEIEIEIEAVVPQPNLSRESEPDIEIQGEEAEASEG
ncbi:hypothetical protein MBM_03441 [Drepanopeziza brunnea f. sp. 'multigermtubi' MB_m1]|uniref:Uncharacterized protein n=1 Tax=Marssonina brunnea f. sp. multigermtubi (strain MB_m1) TaxID=1072389 RepID=K1XCF1_MARBU|nr:uncharacterized protein MBM_03441 [Drepanopeziza brunnea f. sp. 'multigermtubi' MB_m1]EKD18448.1 hypothetical protein MBM_03441 [Drepanopeziza brunnea f. sp. 'multigermtubi' MB_m1]